MRTREMEMLNDTLKIFEEGFYIKEGGEKKDIKLSKKVTCIQCFTSKSGK